MTAKDTTLTSNDRTSEFSEFFAGAEPRLRRSLVAAYGGQLGRDAAANALAWAWEHWDELAAMNNPLGYLYRVGQSSVRERKVPVSFDAPMAAEPWVEPGLAPGLAALSERQRVAVVLIHGFGWTHREVAEMTGTSVTTVQNHLERGLASLRRSLGADHD
jgi:DNA-directed RNA polymerase specialized sigma24 family protein